MAELVSVLEYLNSKSIAHRDLKPDNCLLDQSMHIKLSDFGAAKRCPVGTSVDKKSKEKPKQQINRGTLVGTQEYA